MLKNKYNLFAIAAIFVLISILAATNWRPDTFLTGWDNLHPEFNFAANIKRTIFGVWQEYQGLGTVGGMGLAADLPRQILLYFASFIIPTQLLRYTFHFLMLFTGTIGAYFFIKEIILYRLEEKRGTLASFVGAMFYLFNLATLQMFYVPFEPFSAHFGFLPWLFFANVHFFRMKDKKSLLFLFFINILAVIQNSVATFFYVYLFTLLILLLVVLYLQRRVREIIIALFLLISVNGFWLFPNIYYAIKKTDEHVNAKVNLMSTEDSFLMNKKYGNIENTMLLKGFWFDNKQTDANGNVQYQMSVWIEHLKNPLVLAVGYVMFLMCVAGIVIAVRRRVWGSIFLLPLLIFSFTIISNDTPVFAQITELLYRIPLFSQVFRFPFTKFAILTSLLFSMYFAICFIAIFQQIKNKQLKRGIFVLFIGLLVFFCYPMFTGKLFYDRNRLKIPKEYFQVFDFFKQQNKNERITTLPQSAYWEWTFYRWNYQGAGILWNGIEQPILDRAFDVWGKENENYYHEITYAIYSENSDLLRKVLDKYQARWIILDGNVINPNSAKAANTERLKEMIKGYENVQLVKSIGNIDIYKINSNGSLHDYVFLLQNSVNVKPLYQWNNYDIGYTEYGNYISFNSSAANQVYYPFRSLFTGRKDEEREFKLEDSGDEFVFTANIPKELAGGKLMLPAFNEEEITEINESDYSVNAIKSPKIFLDGELVQFDGKSPQVIDLSYIKEGRLEIRIPKIGGYYSYTNEGNILEPQLCDEESKGRVSFENIEEEGQKLVRFGALNSKICLAINIPQLSNRVGYLASITSRYNEGKPLLFWWENINNRRGDIELNLRKDNKLHQEYIIQPPMEYYALGYTLHFDNISIGMVQTVNDLGQITVNPIPYRFLTGLKIVKGNSNPQPTTYNSQLISVDHPNPSLYLVNISNRAMRQSSNNLTLVLSQSFDPGWHAYQITNDWLIDSWYMKLLIPFFQPEIKDHVLVNNWENGWLLNNGTIKQLSNRAIVIIYLPQYLEYLGFGLLGISILYLLLTKQIKTS